MLSECIWSLRSTIEFNLPNSPMFFNIIMVAILPDINIASYVICICRDTAFSELQESLIMLDPEDEATSST